MVKIFIENLLNYKCHKGNYDAPHRVAEQAKLVPEQGNKIVNITS